MIGPLGLTLALLLGFAPPEDSIGEETAPTEAPTSDGDTSPDHEPSAFVFTAGVAPPRNVWPTRQLCDLDPELRPACLLIGAEIVSGYRFQ
ncbi:MAG: hypothetical protein KC431_20585, partial [Myxococcales bacterium]|nr:hypothetical protein [Myxococcales bacterium]